MAETPVKPLSLCPWPTEGEAWQWTCGVREQTGTAHRPPKKPGSKPQVKK